MRILLPTLITLSDDGINANHIPMHLIAEDSKSGILIGHVARANDVWRNLDMKVGALAIFQGPHGYITPSWYPTKMETGKVVPTWNYAVVHARGPIEVVEEADWIKAQLELLTNQQESALTHPWKISDAPSAYIDKLIKGIVGIKVSISTLTGKWKMSQNQTEANRTGVKAGLQSVDLELATQILVAEKSAN